MLGKKSPKGQADFARPSIVFPCDLPTWPTVENLLLEIQSVKSTDEMVTLMLKIHDLCNISVETPGKNTLFKLRIKILKYHSYENSDLAVYANYKAKRLLMNLVNMISIIHHHLVLESIQEDKRAKRIPFIFSVCKMSEIYICELQLHKMFLMIWLQISKT